MEATHTPGPWRLGEIKERGQEVWINTSAPDERLMYSRWDGLAVAYGCDEQREQGAEVALANARLIAAAPDLLAVAQKLVRAADESTDALNFSLLVDRFISEARAAIAKATGA